MGWNKVFLFWLVICAVASLVLIGGVESRLREILAELRQIRDLLATRSRKQEGDPLDPDP
jgi:hypothetical protein